MPAPVRKDMVIVKRRRRQRQKILNIPERCVLVASTGVIGMQLPIETGSQQGVGQAGGNAEQIPVRQAMRRQKPS